MIPRKHLGKYNSINTIVWWNATASSWMIQTYDTGLATTISKVNDNDNNCPNFSNSEDWKILPTGTIGVIKSRCLTDQNKCQDMGEFDVQYKMYFLNL